MKRLGIYSSIFLTEFFLLPIFSLASAAVCPEGFDALCKIGPESNSNFFGNIIQMLIVVAVILCVIFLIYGGIRWITSGGDKAKVDQAQKTLTAALIGLVISLLAYGIVNFVYAMFGGKGLNSLQINPLTQ